LISQSGFTCLRADEKLYEELLTEEDERNHPVDHKVFVAQGPPSPADPMCRRQATTFLRKGKEPDRGTFRPKKVLDRSSLMYNVSRSTKW
jgi:FlaA1/EpsC-like NDP-sugar epimerase